MVGTQLSRRYQSWRTRSRSSSLSHQEDAAGTAVSWWNDLMTARLLPIKMTFFFIMGATQCIAPYGTVFMKSLGLSLQETAIIYSVAGIIPLAAPLLAGFLTDKMGNFRIFLVVTVALSGIISLFNLAIPPARTYSTNEKNPVPFELTCGRANFQIYIEQTSQCKLISKDINIDVLNVTNCGYRCDPSIIDISSISMAKMDQLAFKIFHNNTVSYKCLVANNQPKCLVTNTAGSRYNFPALQDFELSKVPISLSPGKFKWSTDSRFAEVEIAHTYKMRSIDSSKFECPTGHLTKDIHLRKISIGDAVIPQGPNTLIFARCHFHCDGNITHEEICEEGNDETTKDVMLSLCLFGVLKVVSQFMIGLTYSMFEAGAIAILKEHNNDYGWQRMYGSIGGMIFAPFTGFLIDYYGTSGTYTDYYLTFIMYFIIKIICSLFMIKLDLDFRNPARSICGNILRIASNLEALLLIFIVFVSGFCYGFIENFLPWYMKDLGAQHWLIGTMTTVASISAIPFLALSGWICNTFGHAQSISFGLVCYSVRCLGYSLISNPYWCFPFELLEGVTTGLLVAAAVMYGAKLSSKSNVGTMQGILATSHYGLGKSLGSLSGGYMMAKLSAPIAFRIFSGISFAFGFLYYLCYKLFLFPRQERALRSKRAIMEMPITYMEQENREPDSSKARNNSRL